MSVSCFIYSGNIFLLEDIQIRLCFESWTPVEVCRSSLLYRGFKSMIPTLPDGQFFNLRFEMESMTQSKDRFRCLWIQTFHQKKYDQKRTRFRKVIKIISRGGRIGGMTSTPRKKSLFCFYLQPIDDSNSRQRLWKTVLFTLGLHNELSYCPGHFGCRNL